MRPPEAVEADISTGHWRHPDRLARVSLCSSSRLLRLQRHQEVQLRRQPYQQVKRDRAWSPLVEGDEQPYRPCGKSS